LSIDHPTRITQVSDTAVEQQDAGLLAEEAEQRDRLLSEISRIFLDYVGTDEVEPLRRVADRVTAGLGDWCAFYLVQPDALVRPVVAYHPDPKQRELAEQFLRAVPPTRWDLAPPEMNVFQLRRPLVWEELSDDTLRGMTQSEESFELLRKVGLTSLIVAPMQAGEEPIGTLVLATAGPGGRRYSQRDLDFVLAITDRAALAVRNARLTHELSRQRDEAEHRAAELFGIVAASPNGVLFFGPDDRLKFANTRFSELFQVSIQASIGLPFLPIFESLRQRWTTPGSLELLKTEEVFRDRSMEATCEVEAVIGGVHRTLHETTFPIRSAEGAYLGRNFIFTDLTAQRELDRQRTNFLSVASHELRTPLTPLSIYLQSMEKRLAKGEPIEVTMVTKARRQVSRLTSLIDDLLDLSRLEAGRLDLRRQVLSLDALAAEIVSDFHAATSQHELLLERPAAPVLVVGDQARLEQVIVNLLQNAMKYSPDGGRITLRVEAVGAEAKLTIKDEGIGIPAEEQEQLFRRFFRARNATTMHFGGLGMGLYISHEIISHHGGRFEVRSEPGHGAAFAFYLPLSPSEATRVS
jgi:signal transduction histidine kinase